MASISDSLSSTWVVHQPSGDMLAWLSGFSPIITTTSFHNTEFLSSPGATHVLDHMLSTTPLKDAIVKITPTPITLAFDAISLPDTQQIAHDIVTAAATVVTMGIPQVENENENGVVQQVFGDFRPPPNHELGLSYVHARLDT